MTQHPSIFSEKDLKPDKDKSGGEEKGEEKADPDLMGSIAEPGSHQALAVLGIALIAMGEDIGAEMSLRTFNHLVRVVDWHSTCIYFTPPLPSLPLPSLPLPSLPLPSLPLPSLPLPSSLSPPPSPLLLLPSSLSPPSSLLPLLSSLLSLSPPPSL